MNMKRQRNKLFGTFFRGFFIGMIGINIKKIIISKGKINPSNRRS